MGASNNEPSWAEYYQKVAHRPPRTLLLQAAERYATPGLAIDLGCGGGIETQALLQRGWQVIAVDQEPAAIDYVTAHFLPRAEERLTTHCATFTDLALPKADLIWAGLSLPFCPPGQFPVLWEHIRSTLRPGGRFAGDLFGTNHAWRQNPALTFLSREQVLAYLHTFEIELLAECEEERPTTFQGMQHWHGFDIIARKPA
jgi:tellurite methyltransferase